MYKMIKGTKIIEGKSITTYGLQKGPIRILDISTDCISVENFIAMLNRNKVSEIHIYEVVEDFIG